MGILQKPVEDDFENVRLFIPNQPQVLVWNLDRTENGIDFINVQGYSDAELAEALEEYQDAKEYPKILRWSAEADPDNFTRIDYIRGLDIRLAPQRTFTNGVLTRVDFYASVTFDPNTGSESFSDLVLTEEYNYTRNADGFAVARVLTISWMTEAQTYHARTKSRYKTYNLTESLRETARRRQNVLDTLQSDMIGIFVTTGMTTDQAIGAGMDFFQHHINEITAFKEIGALTALINAITADTTHTWLDTVIAPPSTDIRAFIIGRLSEAYLGT